MSADTAQRPVLVVDFGAQYAQLIARRVREAGVFSELVPHTVTRAEVEEKNPVAMILSGGPSSVYAEGAPSFDASIFDLRIPTLGICYGFQVMAQALGGEVAHTGSREYGATDATLVGSGGTLLEGDPGRPERVDEPRRRRLPRAEGLRGPRLDGRDAGRGLRERRRLPLRRAVAPRGEALRPRPARHRELPAPRGAGCRPTGTAESVIEEQVARIREQVGGARVISALSGGVDSAVSTALVHRAIGDQLTAVFVDHGLLRKGEREQVEQDYVASTGVRLITVDAADTFLGHLEGVSDPETKRKIIGREFIRSFEKVQRELVEEARAEGEPIRFLVQGTLYPDVVESGGGSGTANIKSHHNVGGLPDDLEFGLIEPLRTLFKDEVRQIGRELGIPEEIVGRQPFPGPGLAIRIIGEVTRDRLETLREADAIAREELTAAGLDGEIWQCPVVLLADVRSVGVQGDGRTYGHPVVLRPVSSEDAMTADWTRLPYDVLARISNRITNEVAEVNRVTLDVTSKPPATIEWE